MFARVVSPKKAPSGKHATIREAGPSEESAARQSEGETFAPGRLSWDFRNIPIQAKLEIGATDDPLEREANRAAAEVMRMPMLDGPRRDAKASLANASGSGHAASVQRKCSCGGTCASCKAEQKDDDHQKVRLKPQSAGLPAVSKAAPAIVHQVLSEPGQPLNAATRAFFETRFDHDFSRVQVHSGPRAAASARAVNARAYTVGNHIVFRNDEFNRSETEGRTLVAHELAHVIQQSAAGAPVALARQPSSSTAEDDMFQAFLDMPQVEKDRLMSMGPKAAPAFNPTGAFAPPATTPAADVGCHTDPHKSSPGQSKCNVSHHKSTDDATRATTALMNSPLAANLEKENRAQLDRLNAAYLLHKRTGNYIYRDEFSPYEIEKGNIIATSERWDRWMNSRRVGINNLEAAKFDARYFRSQSEFNLERRRREQEYKDKLNDCKKEGGLKWPKASRTKPDNIVCEEQVNAEYGPTAAAAKEAGRLWAYHQLPELERIENAGPVTTAALAVGGAARVISGGKSRDAIPSALALGSVGDALAWGPGATPLQGTAHDPGAAPGDRIEFVNSGREPIEPPKSPAGGGAGQGPTVPPRAPAGGGAGGGGDAALGGAIPMPVKAGQTIVDNETLIALDKHAQPGVGLSPRETTIVAEMQGRPIITTPTAAGQFREAGMRGSVPVTKSVEHSAQERQDIVRSLETAGVGTRGGAADRDIVADAFLAQTAPNTVPVFATSDGGIINGLFRLSGMNPANMGGYNVREYLRYNRGLEVFVVAVGERVLVVRPLQPVGPRH